MNLYPAIDLYQGKVVRLTRGDYARETVYSNHPDQKAKEYENKGAAWIHIVDLEGAKEGEIKNFVSLKKIRESVSCRLQFGGGVRRLEDIGHLVDAGVDRVILGTRALDEDFFCKVLDKFGSRIAVSLDVRDGKVQTNGWLQESHEDIAAVLERLSKSSLETVIYTDIQKDGMLEGPNLEGLKQLIEKSSCGIILAGGISKIEDIAKCCEIKDANFDGVIIGKALYENRLQLDEALRLTATSKREKDNE